MGLKEAIVEAFDEQRTRENMRKELLAELEHMVEEHESAAQALRDAVKRLER